MKPQFNISLAAFILFIVPVSAQQVFRDGISNDILKKRWPAQWISCADAPGKQFGIYYFRKSFELSDLPEKFIIHVSADNRYRLFVNGESVCTGPARGDLQHWRFESVDIRSFLKYPGGSGLEFRGPFAEFPDVVEIGIYHRRKFGYRKGCQHKCFLESRPGFFLVSDHRFQPDVVGLLCGWAGRKDRRAKTYLGVGATGL